MGRRHFWDQVRNVRTCLSTPPRYRERWLRRAQELAAKTAGRPNLSLAVVADADAAMKLRRDLHQPLRGVSYTARLMRGFADRGGMPVEEITRVAEHLEKSLGEIDGLLRAD
jgi:hypothetical protein